jgi:hypothetical protein
MKLSGSKNTNKLGGTPLQMVTTMESFGILMDLQLINLKSSIATLSSQIKLNVNNIQIVNGPVTNLDAP